MYALSDEFPLLPRSPHLVHGNVSRHTTLNQWAGMMQLSGDAVHAVHMYGPWLLDVQLYGPLMLSVLVCGH